jgi:hypothetical protein
LESVTSADGQPLTLNEVWIGPGLVGGKLFHTVAQLFRFCRMPAPLAQCGQLGAGSPARVRALKTSAEIVLGRVHMIAGQFDHSQRQPRGCIGRVNLKRTLCMRLGLVIPPLGEQDFSQAQVWGRIIGVASIGQFNSPK